MITYKEAIKKSMEELAKDNTIFIGYNIGFGSKAYGTLADIPKSKILETPVAESLMIGLAIGMALEGYKPIVFFERHDFILNSLDGIVNHLSKFKLLTGIKLPIIIRATVGSKKPLHPGPQHIQDFTSAFKKLIKFKIYEPKTAKEVLEVYKIVRNSKEPLMIIERRELYER